ncbi:MAG TPA: hypothetical protein VKG78_05295, partial [Opitutaceae bacterium]|nr:hypothetical protein [Opitutaceae bacterium]
MTGLVGAAEGLAEGAGADDVAAGMGVSPAGDGGAPVARAAAGPGPTGRPTAGPPAVGADVAADDAAATVATGRGVSLAAVAVWAPADTAAGSATPS